MSDGMFAVDGILDPECGAALKTALDSLAKSEGRKNERIIRSGCTTRSSELVHHAMDQGTLPRRNGVRPTSTSRPRWKA